MSAKDQTLGGRVLKKGDLVFADIGTANQNVSRKFMHAGALLLELVSRKRFSLKRLLSTPHGRHLLVSLVMVLSNSLARASLSRSVDNPQIYFNSILTVVC